MYSQCPTCKAIYSVSEADLASHHGLVRCGYCSGVFNARTNEVDGIRAKPDDTADKATGGAAPPVGEHAGAGQAAPSRAPGEADAAGQSHAYQDRADAGADGPSDVEEDHGWNVPGPDPDDQAPDYSERPLIEPVLPGARTVAERVQVEPSDEAASEPTDRDTTDRDEAAPEAPAPQKPSPDDMPTGEPASREPVRPEATSDATRPEEAPRSQAPTDEPALQGPVEQEPEPEEATPEEALPEQAAPEQAAPEQAAPEEAVPEEALPEEALPEEALPEEALPEEALPEEAAPEEAAPEEAAPEEAAPEEAVHEEAALEEAARGAPPVADETDLPGEITEEITIEAPPVLWNAFDEETEEWVGRHTSTDIDDDPDARIPGAVEGRREPASGVRGNLAGQPAPGAAGGRRARRAPLRSPYGDPDIAMVELPQPGPFKTATLSLLTVLLALLLVWQVKSFYLDDLAQVPAVRPYLESLCRPLGCVLPPRRDFARIDLVGTSIDVNPEYPGALEIQASLINRAGFPQPYPPLRVTLTDREGRVVGRRTYLPSEYRAGDGERLPVREVSNVSINLARPAENAVGYEVELIAPVTDGEG